MSNKQMRGQQSGFTLIELVVVIVILGILAATALPRFTDLSTDARMAKANAAVAAVKTGSSLFHAQWLADGSPAGTATVTMEGVSVPYQNGYPDVGGDGPAADSATATTASGIVVAAGGLVDYAIPAGSVTATQIFIATDANHTSCAFSYTQATTSSPPVINDTAITTSNC